MVERKILFFKPKKRLRNRVIVFGLTIILILTSITSVSNIALGGAAPQVIRMFVSPHLQLVPAGNSASFMLTFIGEDAFEGYVNFTGINFPNYISAEFTNNSVFIVGFENINRHSEIVIHVAKEAPIGFVNLTIKGSGFVNLTIKGSSSFTETEVYVALNIIEPIQINTVTSTVMSNITITTTSTITETETRTSTETVTDHSIYIWAVGATIIAIVFPIILTLKRRR